MNEKYVCLTAFKTLFDISKYKFDVAESDLYSATIHRNTGKKKPLEWAPYISNFFITLIATVCDNMPNNNIK